MSDTSVAYPRFDKATVEGVRRAAEVSRRRADMAVANIFADNSCVYGFAVGVPNLGIPLA